MAARYRKQGVGKKATLGFGGDVSLGGLIDQSLPSSLPDSAAIAAARKARKQHPLLQRGMRTAEVWGDCVGDLQTNVTALSLVSPLTMHAQRSRTAGGGTKREAQAAHPLQVEALVDANVDVVSLANGHSMDFHEEGLLDTWDALHHAGVAHAGSGAHREAAFKPVVLDACGRKVAYLSVSAAGCGFRDASGVEMWAAGERRPGIAHFELWDVRMHDEAIRELRDAVRVTRERQRVTFVVVSVCWGTSAPDGKPLCVAGAVPSPMRAFARALIDEVGADIVHGHGTSHMLGVEVYRKKPILYSCGVLLSDRLKSEALVATRRKGDGYDDPSLRGPPRPELRPDVSYIAHVVIRGTNEIGWVELRPVHCRMLQANRAKGRHHAWAVETLHALTTALGAKVEVSRAGLRVRVGSMALPEEPAPPPRRTPRGEGRQQAAGTTALKSAKSDSSWWTRLGDGAGGPENDAPPNGGAGRVAGGGEGGDDLREVGPRLTRAWRWLASLPEMMTRQPERPGSPLSSNMIEPVDESAMEMAPPSPSDDDRYRGARDECSTPSKYGLPRPASVQTGRRTPQLSPQARSPAARSPAARSPAARSPAVRKSPKRSPGGSLLGSGWSPSALMGTRWEAVPGSHTEAIELEQADENCPAQCPAALAVDQSTVRIDVDGGGARQQRRSPGVRRGGRLGSPTSPVGASRSLWSWADAAGGRTPLSGGGGAAGEALLEERDSEESDEEERIPLSDLMRSLNGA